MLLLGGNTERAVGERVFWPAVDHQQLITWKKLNAVRLAVLSFLPLLSGRKVLHEDNQANVALLNHPTSRSPTIIDDLGRLWELIDTYNINCHILAI
jgi:hypothetical protein